jgi:HlyD family secretion protein
MKKWIIFLLVVGVVLAGGGYGAWYLFAAGRSDNPYRTETVTRGDLLATISATGTVEPQDVIDVGAQVAGQITKFGTDADGKPIYYGSRVLGPHRDSSGAWVDGTALAFIDEKLYKAKVDQSQAKYEQAIAQVAEAEANVKKSEADVQQSQAKFDQAKQDWDRAQGLFLSKSLSQSDYDMYKAAFDTTKAALALSKAALVLAQVSVKDSQANQNSALATLEQDKINLGYCTITSPVDGVIIDRRVTLGQTVQSSFNTPSLFLIARDLSVIDVWASVNEADIGRIKIGQTVKFTADGCPGETFDEGKVHWVRLNATMTNNVVTYTVEVETKNPPDETAGRSLPFKLLPYLTANLKFQVEERKDVLTVSNEALRWKPQQNQITPSARKPARPPREQGGPDQSKEKADPSRGVVWVRDGAYVRPVKVKLGLSDGARTEIMDGIDEGAEIVTGDAPQGNNSGGATNPFTPQLFQRRS